MPPSYISSEHVSSFDWLDLLAALEAGYAKSKGASDGSFISQSGKALLTRSAWIDEIGAFVKTITYCPSNLEQGLHPVQGTASLFHADTGQLAAHFEPDFLTQWKTDPVHNISLQSVHGFLGLCDPATSVPSF